MSVNLKRARLIEFDEGPHHRLTVTRPGAGKFFEVCAINGHPARTNQAWKEADAAIQRNITVLAEFRVTLADLVGHAEAFWYKPVGNPYRRLAWRYSRTAWTTDGIGQRTCATPDELSAKLVENGYAPIDPDTIIPLVTDPDYIEARR